MGLGPWRIPPLGSAVAPVVMPLFAGFIDWSLSGL